MTDKEIKVLKAELEKFSSAEEEARNVEFINALCDSFRDKLLSYYQAGGSSNARLRRVGMISAGFRDIKFKVGQREITIAAKKIKPKPPKGKTAGAVSAVEQTDEYRCPTGTQCIDGNCVPSSGGKRA